GKVVFFHGGNDSSCPFLHMRKGIALGEYAYLGVSGLNEVFHNFVGGCIIINDNMMGRDFGKITIDQYKWDFLFLKVFYLIFGLRGRYNDETIHLPVHEELDQVP